VISETLPVHGLAGSLFLTFMREAYNERMKKQKHSRRYETNEVKCHMSALAEDFQDRVNVIAEQYGGIRQDLNDVKRTVNSHTEMIGNLAVQMEIVRRVLR
jgi:hypothetical protein